MAVSTAGFAIGDDLSAGSGPMEGKKAAEVMPEM